MNHICRWLQEYALPLRLFFITRLGVLLVIYIGMIAMPLRPEVGRGLPNNLVLDGFVRWDAGWYGGIINNGYQNTLREEGRDTAFFPMYPLVSWLVMHVTGNAYTAGILVSHLCFLGALLLLHKFLKERYGLSITQKALTLLCVNPFAIFFGAVYTESLLLLAISCGFFLAYRERWILAALAFAFASVTRLVGGLGMVSLLLIYAQNHGWNWRRIIKPSLAIGITGCLGVIAFLAYQQAHYGDALQFLHSQDAWGGLNPFGKVYNFLAHSVYTYSILEGRLPAITLANVSCLGIAVAALLWKWKKVGYPLVVFSLLCIAISFPRFTSMGRFLIVQFPVFIALAFCLQKEWLYQVVLYLSIMLLSLFCIVFSQGYWLA